MTTKRIIPCLDVAQGIVVKGVRFQKHRIIGEILPLAQFYAESGADELVFYDIRASCDATSVCPKWVHAIAETLHIPFTVAGGIRDVDTARLILEAGADKVSINTPALENPSLITELAEAFGSQAVVIGMDSLFVDDDYYLYQYTGDPKKSKQAKRKTKDWIHEVQERGAGEIVLNCMAQDGVRQGYDLTQLAYIQDQTQVPLIASGGAGSIHDFVHLFQKTNVDGALAASIFHDKEVQIQAVKEALDRYKIEVRL